MNEVCEARPMIGNEAIARGAWEAGVKVAAAYPGTPSTEILEYMGSYPSEDLHAQWSTNEKVACDVAIGAGGLLRNMFPKWLHRKFLLENYWAFPIFFDAERDPHFLFQCFVVSRNFLPGAHGLF